MACGYCGKDGHNVRKCPDRLSERLEETAQQVASQGSQIAELTDRMQAVEREVSTLSQIARSLELWLGVVGMAVWVGLRSARALPPEFDSQPIFVQVVGFVGAAVFMAWLAKKTPILGHLLQNL